MVRTVQDKRKATDRVTRQTNDEATVEVQINLIISPREQVQADKNPFSGTEN